MADTLLRPEEVNRDLIAQARVFHFGSVTLAAEPSAAATLAAARWAHASGCLVSFDPNVRLELWDSPRRALDSIVEALHLVERYRLVGPDHIEYEVTVEDPKVFTRPWKMSMPLYRRKERNVRILEYECYAYVHEEEARRRAALPR